jgi:hypothetical protein
MTDTLEVRIAHLEGAYEQIDKRLGSVESTLVQFRSDLNASTQQLRSEMGLLRSEINSDMSGLRSEIKSARSELTGRMDGQFHWLLGTILTTWMTVLLAVFFR